MPVKGDMLLYRSHNLDNALDDKRFTFSPVGKPRYRNIYMGDPAGAANLIIDDNHRRRIKCTSTVGRGSVGVAATGVFSSRSSRLNRLVIFVEQVGYFTTNCQMRGDRI